MHYPHDKATDPLGKQIDARDSVSKLMVFMEDLPQQQQLVLQLRDIEQYDFATIAQITELSEGAVRVALSRARKKIKAQLIKAHNHGID